MKHGRVLWRRGGPPEIEVVSVDVDAPSGRWPQVAVRVQRGIPGVVVIAERNGHIVLVKQFRPAAGRSMWELPRGFGEAVDQGDRMDAASTAVRSAAREFGEETGLRLEAGEYLGSFFPDSGLQTNVVSVVYGRVEGLMRGESDDEVDDLVWVETSRISELVKSGYLSDGMTLAALAMWRANFGQES